MTKHLLLLFLIVNIFPAKASSLRTEELDYVYSLRKTNVDSAFALSYELLKKCNNSDDYYGLVKLNFFLGFLHKEDNNFGKSVLHYLEAVRYAEKADYANLIKDKVSIRQNLANTYRIYKANDLAISYYKEAIELAEAIEDKKNIISMKFNVALTYVQNDQTGEAISLFKELLDISSKERKSRIFNELGLIYWQIGEPEEAKKYFNSLLDLDEGHKIYTAKALHNLGEIEFEYGDPDKAIELINESIRLKKNIEDVDQRSLFISCKVFGDFLFSRKKLADAQEAYLLAESLISSVKNESFSFELYRSLSELNYEFGNQTKARQYSNLYSRNINEYLITQQGLQEHDHQYNINLITQRYFDEIIRQERIASILFYSKLISGTLLGLLLFTIGFNQYRKVQLRKSIVRSLINFKFIDKPSL